MESSKALTEIKRQIKQALGQRGIIQRQIAEMRGKPKNEEWEKKHLALKEWSARVTTLQHVHKCVAYAESR